MTSKAEDKLKDNEEAILTEDEFDGPIKKYHPLAAPWYTDQTTVLMLVYLCVIFLGGFIILVTMIITKDPWAVFGITSGFVALTVVGIYTQVRLAKYC